jgi:hypothetical protein
MVTCLTSIGFLTIDARFGLPYTWSVQRLIATVLAFALIAAAGHLSRLHTHAYAEHDHPEHQHAPAAHDHLPSPPHHDRDDEGPHLESCDPGQHEVTLTVASAPAPNLHTFDAQVPQRRGVDTLDVDRPLHDATEDRAHGPPPRALASPRAPPAISPA